MSKAALHDALRRNSKLVKRLSEAQNLRADFLARVIERDQQRRDRAQADQAAFYDKIMQSITGILPSLLPSLGAPSGALSRETVGPAAAPAPDSHYVVAPAGAPAGVPFAPFSAAHGIPGEHVWIRRDHLETVMAENERLRNGAVRRVPPSGPTPSAGPGADPPPC